jgi:hypothetical protein
MPNSQTLLLFGALSLGAQPAWSEPVNGHLVLEDVGVQSPRRPRVVVVATPGVRRDATLIWERALEDAGFDAWRVDFQASADRPEHILSALSSLDVLWSDQPYAIVAHGYAGRLVVDADLGAEKMVLVGAPLGPQLVPTLAAVPAHLPVLDGLPWPEELLGALPQRPLSAALAEAFVNYGLGAPAADPRAPLLLLASGADVVGPPECNRLPSRGWSDRRFVRLDVFSYGTTDHAGLLSHPGAIRQMIRFLKED